MRYFTYLKDAKAASPGASVRFARGKGYYLAGGSGATPGGSSGGGLYGTALKLAQQSEAPVLAAMEAQQKRYDTDATQKATNTTGFYQALAKLLGGAGADVQTGYDNAASATGAFAKGLSDAEQHIANNENSSMSDFLSKMGMPQDAVDHVTSKIGGTGDLLYGLGGYIPAAGLEREGAAFRAAADNLPAYAGGLGLEALTSQGHDQANQDSQFADQIAQERGKIPGAAQSLYNDMLTRRQQQESIDIQNAYLNNTQRGTDAKLTGIDPVSGQPIPGYHLDPKTGGVVKDVPAGQQSPKVKAAAKRESAFATAQKEIFDDAKGLVSPMTIDDQIAWVASHPGSRLADAPKTNAPAYAAAAKQLFDKYKYLLKFASRSGQAALKKRLNQIISDALSAQGIVPVKKPPKPVHISLGPTVPGVVTDPFGPS